ncbi:MAG: NAD(P)-dependent oxidoreductase [Burkholderiales bacterium]|nr:NAD(P)-dependent oxidoreductase [Burkholderiales bacterium]
MLHDGHAWDDFASTLRAGTRRAMRAARDSGAPMLVHASFAFVHAVEQGARVGPPLRAAVRAVRECEALVLSGPVPACVVRLGYLYGPASADLRAYRIAFGLGRPYWSGAASTRQYHLHQLDAGAALIGAAQPQNAGRIMYATDGTAVSFRQLMDAFAQRVGRPSPWHLPPWSRWLARLFIREAHMQQVALCMPRRAPTPRVPGWRPRFPDYGGGLDQLIQAWHPDAQDPPAHLPARG